MKISLPVLFKERARLKIFGEDGKMSVFNDIHAAVDGLRDFGVSMDIPPEEPDLESTLQAVGWQSPCTWRRRTPACEMMNGVTALFERLKE